MLRTGRTGSNDAADHLETLDRALAQLPVDTDEDEMLVRTDTAGATHDFVEGCQDRDMRFSIGLPVDQRVRDALVLVQEEAQHRRRPGGSSRPAAGTQRLGRCVAGSPGVTVAELADR